MNCQSFEEAINDLAREQVMDAEARQRAIAHAAACERCEARLADERALTAGLLKMADSGDEAPARVEASLREAFGTWVAPHREPAVVAAVQKRRRWLGWAGAAAAAILLVALLASTADRSRTVETRDLQEQASQEKQAQQSGTIRPVDPQPEPAPRELAAAEPTRPRAHGHRDGSRGGHRRARRPEAKPLETVDTGTEIATEFIPLVHGGDVAIPDGGQIMRVELPRSALVSFGLPMNMERVGERVRADVVVGNDGLARAIRFVR